MNLFSRKHKRNPLKTCINLHKREILLIFALSLQELRGKDENMKQENKRIDNKSPKNLHEREIFHIFAEEKEKI